MGVLSYSFPVIWSVKITDPSGQLMIQVTEGKLFSWNIPLTAASQSGLAFLACTFVC